MPDPDLHITALVETFSRQLIAAVEASAVRIVQTAIAGALGLPPRHGRPPRKIAARQLSRMPWFERPASSTSEMTCLDLGMAAKSKSKSKSKKRRMGKVATPKVARARKLQGRYLGLLRSLTGADREKVQRIAKERGVAQAVKLAQSLKKT